MKNFKRMILVTLVLFVLCGLIYPAVITGISQITMNNKANGSIIKYKGTAVGSELIGQSFNDTRYFHGRISDVNYNCYDKGQKDEAKSGSSNLAPSNKKLAERVKKDIDAFLKEHPNVKKEQIPTDLMTSSGSGLDPNISVEAAKIQVPLISQKTGISEGELDGLISKNTNGRFLGIFGEPRVNVLKLNIEVNKRLK